MTPIFRYNAHRQVLVEQPRMKEPEHHPEYFDHGSHLYQYCFREWQAYNDHITSLREYKVAPGDWREDVDYVEGIDFKNIPQCHEENVLCRYGNDPCCDCVPTAFLWTDECPHDETYVSADSGITYCVECDKPLQRTVTASPERTYTRTELLAEVEKAWEAATKATVYQQEIVSRRVFYDRPLNKKEFFKQNFNHDI